MSRFTPVNAVMGPLLSLLIVQPALATDGETSQSRKRDDSPWSIRLSGLMQFNPDRWDLWYEEGLTTPDATDDFSATNGVQGASQGLEIAVAHRLSDRVSLGLAAGYIPTRLHAEIHHLPTIEAPDANVAFVPVRIFCNYDVLRRSDWRMHIGFQGGAAFFGERDVISRIGRSRHFYGETALLLGGEWAVTYTWPGGFGLSAALLQQFTHFHAEELNTGALPQEIPFSPLTLSVGILYGF